MLTAENVAALVREDLAKIADDAMIARIRELLVKPYPVECAWDYGDSEEVLTCWTVVEHAPSNTGIAYCSKGFGPSNPWGLVILIGDYKKIGMDSSWFISLESAMRESLGWDGTNSSAYEVP